MSYANERKAIETYFIAQWAGATTVIPDGQTGEPTPDSVRLTINSGAVLQGSIGRTSNRHDHIGTLVVGIYTDGALGSAAWRAYADTIIGFLTEVTLNSSGAVISTTAEAFLRFSPPEMGEGRHPYISASFKDAPFHVTNITAPFVRYSYS
ncbi:hypothetical protein BV394_01960 [Brevirhabdus pacifica]|uniref:Uncharacterized protein n=1 Tax=Brevirhabdus pacifica TaxID=1267768 RepID=A0A1U7DFA8_9RHOB|nr:hypothetical protein [Brevirhabdus pacifica]APX88646.1 hypothetical protein BV394_01960 [Brevirhabdus pacifica]OWU79920.1 hypothetical protein ATO5_02650 [Loktanella sp. 22II-4b]PJJ86853.1 hypothetical protein CLV77_1413 [Brevirhabdus pacifica]